MKSIVLLAVVRLKVGSNVQNDSFESMKRQFTYCEVQQITNDFERILGKGGFGTVFYGITDGTEVAVKMLSPSSVQGYEQFKAEACIPHSYKSLYVDFNL